MQPRIVPLSEGTVQFEWRRNGRTLLAIEVESLSALHYLKRDPQTNELEEGILRVTDPDGLIQLLTWLASTQGNAKAVTQPQKG